MTSKYNLFANKQDETGFWNLVFASHFEGYQGYRVANKYDDDMYGVDVWINGRVYHFGAQLKTSRDTIVNIHYYMECKSKWRNPVGINTYVTSPKLDFLIYAYPNTYESYKVSQSDLKLFWEIYADQLCDYALKEYPNNYGGECWKYYFQISREQFEVMCHAIDVPVGLVSCIPF